MTMTFFHSKVLLDGTMLYCMKLEEHKNLEFFKPNLICRRDVCSFIHVHVFGFLMSIIMVEVLRLC